MSDQIKLLIVEDNLGDARLVMEMLKDLSAETGFSVDHVVTLREALGHFANVEYDIALIDLSLPDSAGLDTIYSCLDAAPETPIILLTGSEDGDIALQAIQAGAQDYLYKADLEVAMLGRIIHYAIERKSQETKLKKMARTDELTTLPNRRFFFESLEKALWHAEVSDTDVALLFIDIDSYKLVNDVHGHMIGDEVLRVLATRIQQCIGYGDLVGRLGGDEFAVFVHSDQHTATSLAALANRILQRIVEPISLKTPGRVISPIKLSASIGISLMRDESDDNLTPERLLVHADTAMYKAKENGGDDYCFYDRELEVRAKNRIKITTGLARALERDEFSLAYQPIIETSTGSLCGIEVLLRWNPTEGEVIEPSEFIPLLEESSQIIPVGEWILDNACREYRELVDKWHLPKGTWLCVNFSPRQFCDSRVLRVVEESIQKYQIPKDVLHMEITESTMMEDTEHMIDRMYLLRKLGVRLAIDDFGTGFSSMSYLKKMPVDFLKIDLSFIISYVENDLDRVVTKAMIGLAEDLGLGVIAEGIENKETAILLSEARCSFQQGYYHARPMDLVEFSGWLMDKPG